MKESTTRLEKIRPRLKAGKVTVATENVKFTRTEDRHETIFPKEAHYYLEQFIAGKNIEDIISETYTAGAQIDFSVLRQTLLTLYWGKNIANRRDFQEAIEFTEWLPSIESHLINPIFEFDIKRDDLIGQLFALALPIALIVVALKIFFGPTPPPTYALLLFPLTFLNIKGIISALTSVILNKSPQYLTLQFSFFGIYLKESSGQRSVIGVFEYLINLGTTLLLSTFAIYYFLSSQNILFRDLGTMLSVLISCLLMSPAHKTDFSNLYSYMDLQFRDNSSSAFLKTQLKIMFLNSTGLFLLLALSFFLLSAFTLAQYTNLWPICAIIILLAFGFFLDLLDDFDFIIDQFQGYFISPLRTFFARFTEKNYDIPKLFKEIPIFEALPQNILSEMAKFSKIISVRKGVTLCKEGQESTDLYLMIRGRVGIYKYDDKNSKYKVLELSSGSVFGEGGFFLNRPRTGDAITLTDSIILRINRPPSALPVTLGEMFQKKIWAFQALSRSNFFQSTPPELLMQIVSQSKLYELPINSTVIQQGDISDSMWIILEGTARATVDGLERRNFKVGDVFGEIGIIWNSRRTGSVITTSNTTMLQINSDVLRRIFSSNINLGVALQRLGTDRLKS